MRERVSRLYPLLAHWFHMSRADVDALPLRELDFYLDFIEQANGQGEQETSGG